MLDIWHAIITDMKKRSILLICIVALLFSACSQPDNSINLDSDSSIEKALVGVWETSDGDYKLTFNTDYSATWKLDWYTYTGSYRVSNREMIIDNRAPNLNPVFRVNSMTITTLNITGIGRVAEKYGTLILTKQ